MHLDSSTPSSFVHTSLHLYIYSMFYCLKMNKSSIIAISVSAIVLIAVVIIITLFIVKQMEDKFYYLNTNSTYATKTGYYNASDLGYRSMRMLRAEKEKVFNKIKELVNAPPDAKVILNSGATESIATCVNWAKHYNMYGKIYGTKFDHESIRKNCENQDITYVQSDEPNVTDSNVAAVFITHADSKTGELIDDKWLKLSQSLISMNDAKSDFELSSTSPNVVQHKPLVFVDVTQSITKIPIDMQAMGANALFFSLHKIGGPLNEGILIISEPRNCKFVPLIAGEQNDGLRGGTLNETELVYNRDIFKIDTTPEQRQEKWERIAKELDKNHIDFVKPKGRHLYNTFLIKVDKCPMAIVDELADSHIYIGTMSACSNESEFNKLTGGAQPVDDTEEKFVRLSFANIDDVPDTCIDKISAVINRK